MKPCPAWYSVQYLLWMRLLRPRDAAPSTSMSKPLGAVELPLARVEFVEKSATHTEQHDPLLVDRRRPGNAMS
jgi:hypothetical protein